MDQRAFITSWNVVSMCCGGRWRSPTDELSQTCDLLDQKWRIAYRCIQKIIGVYFYIVWFSAVESIAESTSFRSFFLLFTLDHTTCLFLAWLFCTGNKHVEHIRHDLSGSELGVSLHRGLGFSGYLVYLQMLPFCILQSIEALCGNAYPT